MDLTSIKLDLINFIVRIEFPLNYSFIRDTSICCVKMNLQNNLSMLKCMFELENDM